MLKHHEESMKRLIDYYSAMEGVIAVVVGGSVMHGNARPDSDLDAIIVVTQAEYEKRKRENRLAEVVTGHCTYEAACRRACLRAHAQRLPRRRGALFDG